MRDMGTLGERELIHKTERDISVLWTRPET